jgi:hypothetical protein
LAAVAAAADLRVAFYHTELSRYGPGLLLAAIRDGDPQATAVAQVITRAGPDVLVLSGIDHDAHGAALAALNATLPRPYPHLIALRPNAGIPTGRDLDGDGRIGPRDAQGWGRFPGQGGMAVLSRHPLGPVTDLTGLLWRDLPEVDPPIAPEVAEMQRLASVGHWIVPVNTPGGPLDLLAFHATPPLFQPQNPARNADELRLWSWLLDGRLPVSPPDGDFVIAGVTNVDPADGLGDRAAVAGLLGDSRLMDTAPANQRSGNDPGQAGSPRHDTAQFESAGGLRLDVLLPSARLAITGSGILWPEDGDPFLATVTAASRHRLIWIDLARD